MDNPLTAYIVLGLGNLLGGVTKVLTQMCSRSALTVLNALLMLLVRSYGCNAVPGIALHPRPVACDVAQRYP